MKDTWTGRDIGEPSTEQLAALRQYAGEHGRTWKSALLDDWANGRTTGPLHQVRNTFGPRWLMIFDLKHVVLCAKCNQPFCVSETHWTTCTTCRPMKKKESE